MNRWIGLRMWVGLALGGIPGVSVGAVVHVPGDHPTIQGGIDAAVHSDTVLVAPGTYFGPGNRNLSFGGKKLTLLADGECIIDCQTIGQGLNFESGDDSVVVKGFEVRRAETGVRAQAGSSPTIVECRLWDHSFAGIYATSAHVTVVACEVTECQFGIGLQWSTADIEASMVTANEADVGAGIAAESSTVSIMDSIITGNRARLGGGIYLALSDCGITGSTVASNFASEFGGGLFVSGSTVDVATTLWTENCADLNGSSVYLWPDDFVSEITFVCSAVDTSTVVSGSSIHTVEYSGSQVHADPEVCFPEDCTDTPTSGGQFGLHEDSPCLQQNSPCGIRIGALPQECGPISNTPEPDNSPGAIRVWPNPFRAKLFLGWSGSTASPIEIVDVGGRLVRAIPIERHGRRATWDGRDALGRLVSAGVYFVRIEGRGTVERRSVVFVR